MVTIETQASELLTMVSSIMQAPETESGATTVRKHEVDICQLMQKLRALYDAPLDRNLALIWKYPRSVPTLVTDDVLLTHVLQRLIDNAIKFTKRGTVTVSARVGENFEFQVSDTGIGIPKGACRSTSTDSSKWTARPPESSAVRDWGFTSQKSSPSFWAGPSKPKARSDKARRLR